MRAELTADAAGAAAFPRDGLPEVAILGRSNVGKSSLINRLLGRHGLARTSATPGKTRRVQFYRVEDAAYLVDLPGFGYARVARGEQRSWQPLVESYLRGDRAPLRGCILLMDLRRGPEREELELRDWLVGEGLAVRFALTRADKLPRHEAGRRLGEISARLSVGPGEIALTSSRTGRGLDAPAAWIREWTGLRLTRPDGSPL